MSFSSGSRPAPLPALQLRHCGPAHSLTAPTSSGNIASRTVFLIYYYVGVIDGHDVLFRGLHRPHVKSLPSAPAAAKVSCRQRVPPAPRAAPLRVVPSAFPVRCPMLWRQTVHDGSISVFHAEFQHPVKRERMIHFQVWSASSVDFPLHLKEQQNMSIWHDRIRHQFPRLIFAVLVVPAFPPAFQNLIRVDDRFRIQPISAECGYR